MRDVTVQLNPDDRQFKTDCGINIFEALISAGYMLRSDCGGKGCCGKCLVRVNRDDSQALSRPDERELQFLGEERIQAGYRLSCCTRAMGHIALEIPERSLLTPEVVQKGPPMLMSRLETLASVWQPVSMPVYGVAVDIGTTTIAVYLCDLASHILMGATTVRNPQAMFGYDVISRINAVKRVENGLTRLQKLATYAIDVAVSALCHQFKIDPLRIGSAVVVGNSTMIHLLLGVDPTPIGVFPYAPPFTEHQCRLGGSLGLKFNPDVALRTLPLISGYLGADLIGAALAAGTTSLSLGTLLVDIGTNGEILLVTENGFATSSCATGPAFEGATIQNGMQATSGAIDSVRFDPEEGRLKYTIIQCDSKRRDFPTGICGSGIISTVAELLSAGVITRSGSFNTAFKSPCLREGRNGKLEFEIVSGPVCDSGIPIVLTQNDVRAVQLAKGALRTGIELLCRENKIERPSKILLAGAFGSYINKSDAIRIGMFPKMPMEEIEVVGNAAGVGAVLSLCNDAYFNESKKIAEQARVLDLAKHPDFQATFIDNLSF